MAKTEILETLKVLKELRKDHVAECNAEIRKLTAEKIVKYINLL